LRFSIIAIVVIVIDVDVFIRVGSAKNIVAIEIVLVAELECLHLPVDITEACTVDAVVLV